MSRSAIYTVNNGSQDVADGGIINLGNVVRRFGNNLQLAGNGIRVAGAGYYELDANVVLTPAATGTVTVTAYKDNMAIPGANATFAVAETDSPVTLPIVGMIRENCPCCDDVSTLTLVLSGSNATVSSAVVIVDKL
jgi:hypothetical protein